MSDLPAQQGEWNDQGLVEFLRFADALRLAVFATAALSRQALVLRASRELGVLVDRTPDELAALPLRDLVRSSSSEPTASELVEAELGHAHGRGVPVFLTARQLGDESAIWLWLVFSREPSGQSVTALARQLVHEVSNPLTSVVCRLDLVGRQLPELVLDRGEELGRHLATAQDGTERVISLVREFADALDRRPEIPARGPTGTLPPSSHRRSKRA